MSNFHPGSFTSSAEWIWWNTGSMQITGDVSCTFEEVECEMLTPNVGDIEATLELMTFVGTATSVGLTGDLVASMEVPVLQMHAGLAMECSMEPLEFSSSSFIKGDEMDNCVFKEFTFFGIGDNSYSSIEASASSMECVMYSGSHVELGFEYLDFEAAGTPGLIANVDLTMLRPELTMTGGSPPAIDCVAKEFTLEMGGETEILAKMDVTFRIPSATMYCDSINVAHMNVRFRPLFTQGWFGIAHPVGSIDVRFAPLQGVITGIYGGIGNIDADFENATMSAEAFNDGPNHLSAEMKQPSIVMVSLGVIPCTPHETLEFGDV